MNPLSMGERSETEEVRCKVWEGFNVRINLVFMMESCDKNLRTAFRG